MKNGVYSDFKVFSGNGNLPMVKKSLITKWSKDGIS